MDRFMQSRDYYHHNVRGFCQTLIPSRNRELTLMELWLHGQIEWVEWRGQDKNSLLAVIVNEFLEAEKWR